MPEIPSKNTRCHRLAIFLSTVSWGLYVALVFCGTPVDPELEKGHRSHSNLYLFRVDGTDIVTAPGKEYYFSWIGWCSQDDVTILEGKRELPTPKYVAFPKRLDEELTVMAMCNSKVHREAMVELA